MRTDELALDYLGRAEMTLEEARKAIDNEVYSLAIRRSQETVELSLKAALRYLQLNIPEITTLAMFYSGLKRQDRSQTGLKRRSSSWQVCQAT